ncbi:hypothetical protein TrLO_g12525 [Triparma laevis f. longispina]|uniref:Uncharacterized protein n=1 Tax=Triparma laevis f. longispina TaxID=1714387 RepID=A0A9W7AYT0_9STRA|nr:hypothetical protein TrLO_g12525 [Triparma laevis f. longispina]
MGNNSTLPTRRRSRGRLSTASRWCRRCWRILRRCNSRHNSATRVYSGGKPFISDFYDSFSEVAQIQLFYTRFAALALKVNIDEENLQDRRYFDILLTSLQFVPASAIAFSYRRKHLKEV